MMQARNEESLEKSSIVIRDEACKMVAGEGVYPEAMGGGDGVFFRRDAGPSVGPLAGA